MLNGQLRASMRMQGRYDAPATGAGCSFGGDGSERRAASIKDNKISIFR
jgi:hypothetical protein